MNCRVDGVALISSWRAYAHAAGKNKATISSAPVKLYDAISQSFNYAGLRALL